jgi:hypothetical protein
VAWEEIEVVGTTAQVNPNLKHFGYYWGAGWENFMDEFDDHCNFVYICTNEIERLQEAKQRGMRAVLDVHYLFIDDHGDLWPDYLDKWNQWADQAEPYIDDNVFAFYPIDEPFEFGYSLVECEAVNEAISSRFPDIPIAVTFAKPENISTVPDGYDILSFTPDYELKTEDVQARYNILLSLLQPDQSIMITGDGLARDETDPATRDEIYKVVKARESYYLARREPRVIGFWPFMWPSAGVEGTGIRDMPVLREEYTRIGYEMMALSATRSPTAAALEPMAKGESDYDAGNLIPDDFYLANNHPNPFNPSTTIEFGLPEAASVRLDIYNILGRKVITLIDREVPAGRHAVTWSGATATGASVSTGMYFYRLQAGDFVQSRKMLMLK